MSVSFRHLTISVTFVLSLLGLAGCGDPEPMIEDAELIKYTDPQGNKIYKFSFSFENDGDEAIKIKSVSVLADGTEIPNDLGRYLAGTPIPPEIFTHDVSFTNVPTSIANDLNSRMARLFADASVFHGKPLATARVSAINKGGGLLSFMTGRSIAFDVVHTERIIEAGGFIDYVRHNLFTTRDFPVLSLAISYLRDGEERILTREFDVQEERQITMR